MRDFENRDNHFRDVTQMVDEGGTYANLAVEIGRLVDRKNTAYGDSFAKGGAFLKLLYPDGIPIEKYSDSLCLVRIFDKMMRIATDRDALGESPYADIAGYALLGLKMSQKRTD